MVGLLGSGSGYWDSGTCSGAEWSVYECIREGGRECKSVHSVYTATVSSKPD